MYEYECARVLNLIQNTSGYIDKQYLLRKNADKEGLKEILHFIYNPYVKTGISELKLAKAMEITDIDDNWDTLAIIEYLKGHQTGTDTDLAMVARYINRAKAGAQVTNEPYIVEMAKAVVTQNLKIGVDVKTLNTVFGENFIPRVGCMLGTDQSKVNMSSSEYWPVIVTEKLDGARRILIKENGSCRFFSRSGHEDDGLLDIAKEAKWLPNNCMYDGELLAEGEFLDSIALRQATNSIASSKGIKKGLTYNIFDMVPIAEFYSGKSKYSAMERKTRLAATFQCESIGYLVPDVNKRWELTQAFGIHDAEFKLIKHVPILGLAQNMDLVTPMVAKIWQDGGEGVMLNSARGLYEIKRSKQLIKVKHTEDHILPIIDVLEGTGKFEDMLGALVVEFEGNRLGVGSGFDDSMRRRIWENAEDYIGRKIEVTTFGKSKNVLGTTSLNCPVFKRFVGDEE